MDSLKILTKDLPPYAKLLIRDMREGMFKYRLDELVLAEKRNEPNGETPYRVGLPTDDGFSYVNYTNLADAYKAQGRKRYSPREVHVVFTPRNFALVNVAGFSFNAANGVELFREAEVDTWQGSDGESNFVRQVCFRGPAVAVFGYGRHTRVELYVPTGLSDEHRDFDEETQKRLGLKYCFVESPHRLFVQQTAGRIAKDPMLLSMLMDACMDCKRFSYTEHPDVVKFQNQHMNERVA